jgi:hypothetical protein
MTTALDRPLAVVCVALLVIGSNVTTSDDLACGRSDPRRGVPVESDTPMQPRVAALVACESE